MKLPYEEIESVVVSAVEKAMRTKAVATWPKDRSLHEIPDGIFDSLASLEVFTQIERALRIKPLIPDGPDTKLDTIAGISTWVHTKAEEAR
ncbi:hypothetical protein OHT61_25265 [Streptomyces sp. NBC_00178]|uniref:hypothetical protein n=1 Tax=Streptomyces sp. NBC_00178 TaxID=2975672 RepID=UPI002E29B0E4|nr:hypothetical protein [Streptomyces sp. NBC_00178]